MSALTRREQIIARRYGSTMVCLLSGCAFDLAHIKSSVAGASDFMVEDEKFWMQTTPKGITLSADVYGKPSEVLTWGKVLRHMAAQDDELRRLARRANRLMHTPRPGSYGSPFKQRGGKFDPDVFEHYKERGRRVDALVLDVMDRLFPLALDDEPFPTDLFDFIAA